MSRRCTTCGAEVDVPPELLSTTCRFCDGPMVDVTDGAGPVDLVVPFVVPEDRASELLRGWLERRWFAPAALRRAAAPDALRPVYVPFYAHDAVTRSRWSADVGIEWQRTETYTTMQNGKVVTRTRTVTEVEWFPTDGSHAATWDHHLVSASRGLPQEEGAPLAPYDLGVASPFAPERVAGIVAEHPTVSAVDARYVASGELQREAEEAVRGLMPGDRTRSLHVDTEVWVDRVQLVLAPVWMAVYGQGEGSLRLLVNGQTGEVVGRTPVAAGRVALLVGLVLLGLLLAAGLVLLVAAFAEGLG